MTDDIREDLFANCALWAYVEVAIETGQCPPDSERTRRRAYELFEQAKASEPRNSLPESVSQPAFTASQTVAA